MPFFLVTHTSLVEAEDETGAAVKAYEKISGSDQLSFDVRADESSVRQVKIATVRHGAGKLSEGRDALSPLVHAEMADDSDNHPDDTAARQSGRRVLPPSMISSITIAAVGAFYLIAHLWNR
jgi:hypothetical protein